MLNSSKPEGWPDEDWQLVRSQNVSWLQSMVAEGFWTTEDMTAVNAAIAANT